MIDRPSISRGPVGALTRGRSALGFALGALALVTIGVTAGACKPGSKGGAGSADPGSLSVRSQCDQILATVQQDRAKLDAIDESSDFEKDTRRTATAFQALRDDISRSKSTDSDLKKISSDYQAALTLVVNDLNSIASASKGSDNDKVDQLSKQFDMHIQAVNASDKRLSDYCAKK